MFGPYLGNLRTIAAHNLVISTLAMLSKITKIISVDILELFAVVFQQAAILKALVCGQNYIYGSNFGNT